MTKLNGSAAGFSTENDIQLKMIYNNMGNQEGLVAEWGLSLWIEYSNDAVLFDTGGNNEVFWKNLEHSDLPLEKLSYIVISHNHWDHNGGMEILLEKTNYEIPVMVPADDLKDFESRFPKAILRPVDSPGVIRENLLTTGQLRTTYKGNKLAEQSLILKKDGVLYLLTGCSHFGIEKIVKKVVELQPDMPLELVAGGFHLMRSEESEIRQVSGRLKEYDIRKIAPSHCTGDLAMDIFRDEWSGKFMEFFLGDSYLIS